ncbi:hypothetical protein Nepgr_000967 [Nepenthes gracilis]|uniref:Uncharacterized protein n=1 Tax=Nepenthes gracilis TaxID=150966 RepID=A0AAD3P4D1_NEPGR|nr:hypothetical protein Nepgr_000967 [Nepenthes gracilis]
MGKATFEMICNELNSAVAKEDAMFRAAIPVRQRAEYGDWGDSPDCHGVNFKVERAVESLIVLGDCCMLNNICEMRGEEMDPELRFEPKIDNEMIPEFTSRSVSSMRARDAIAHDILHHGLAGTCFP